MSPKDGFRYRSTALPGLHQPQQAVSLRNNSGSKPRPKKIRRELLHMTHAKIQVVYDTQRARRTRARLPKCAARNPEPGPVSIDEAVARFADSKSLGDEINITLLNFEWGRT